VADALSFMSERQTVIAAEVDELSHPLVQLMRGIPPQISTSGKRFRARRDVLVSAVCRLGNRDALCRSEPAASLVW
jgi:hypothetical protein